MRQCSKCRVYKDDEEFPFKFQLLGRRHSECKDCRNKYQADYYQRTKDQRLEYKAQRQSDKREEARHLVYEYLQNSSCMDCGEFDPLVLTFDHVRGKKKMNISQMVNQGYSVEAILAEISLCEVVCSNCHMRREKKGYSLLDILMTVYGYTKQLTTLYFSRILSNINTSWLGSIALCL